MGVSSVQTPQSDPIHPLFRGGPARPHSCRPLPHLVLLLPGKGHIKLGEGAGLVKGGQLLTVEVVLVGAPAAIVEQRLPDLLAWAGVKL